MAAKKAAAGEDLKFVIKTPKGTRDYEPKQMAVRESVLHTVTETFKRHGAQTIDTPVFELRDVLMGKYGDEGGKLIFDLADQGGELCSLRYDLTVPFARYLAMHKVSNIKRYHIAKVYRRDQPVMTKGRYREFYQCDFDIAGQYDLMVPEAECLKIVDEVLSALDIGEFETKINHRLLLEGMFASCGISKEDFKVVCSSIDKLDKEPWEEVHNELINEKVIDSAAVDKLEGLVRLRELNPDLDNNALLDLIAEKAPGPELQKAVAELKVLVEYAELFGCNPSRLLFEPSLARGLDYYTGAIYEVVMTEFTFKHTASPAPVSPTPTPKPTEVPQQQQSTEDAHSQNALIGSVAAGGRYDKLVGMFANQGNPKKRDADVPCAGISFGIERLFSIMEMKEASRNSAGQRTCCTEVFVASAQKNLLRERMKLCAKLWGAGIRCELSHKANPKMLNQMQYCEEHRVPWAVIVGERELGEGCVKVRNVSTREEVDVKLDELIADLQKRLSMCNADAENKPGQ